MPPSGAGVLIWDEERALTHDIKATSRRRSSNNRDGEQGLR
jgi:hypothetical protein